MPNVMTLMTLDDLHLFCQKEGLIKFSATDYGKTLRVQVPAVFAKKESDEYTLYADIKICHTGRNNNRSSLTDKASKHCMDTLAYKPLLANFTNVNDEWDFTSHDFEEIINEDGEKETVYYEKQIGCFTADKPYMKYDEELQHDYMYGRVAIPRDYTKAAEIIERKGGTTVSVELEVLELSFNAKENLLNIDDAVITGCTCLGVNPNTGEEIKPGMQDAHISLESFSEQNNSMFTTELLDELRKFNKNFEIMNNKEGGKNVNKELFEELLQKYNITEEQIEFDYSELSDDDLAAKFAEVFGEDEGDTPSDDEPEDTGDANTSDNDEGKSEDSDTSDEDGDENKDKTSEGEENFEENEDEENSESETYSLILPDGTKKEFSLSMSEKMAALYNLVNDTYSELDNEWYGVEVFDEEQKVVMIGYFSGACYRQSYKKKKDTFSLEGERVSVHSIFVSEDEEKILNEAKANFEEVSSKLSEAEEKLAKFESESEKIELLKSEAYSKITKTDEYKELAKRETYFDLNKEELEKKLDEVILTYAKGGKLDFSANVNENDKADDKKKVDRKPLPIISNIGKSRYGNLFN